MASDLDERQASAIATDAEPFGDSVDDESPDDYRSLSGLAVAAVIVGIVSLAAFISPGLLFVPIIGIVLGLLAIRRIVRDPEYYTGTRLAVTGIGLSLVLATAAGAMHVVLGVIEVPEGYDEISFRQLQPDKVNHPDMPIPPSVFQLDGRKVFVKGYVFPGTRRTELKNFVLVPDMGTCCFGGDPAPTDMIEVTLQDPLTVDFALRRRGFGGIFRVHRERKQGAESKRVYYELEADVLR